MSDDKPDLTKGIEASSIGEGASLLGRVGDDSVLLVHTGNEWFAVAAECTHYHGPLAEGLIVGDTVRCPWHHACFSLRTGEALCAPALSSLACWQVEVSGDTVFVRNKLESEPKRWPTHPPESIVIVGGGAAALAAAEVLRREGYDGPVTMISADADPPVDRPNLSKDYLAGTAPDEWMPLWPDERFAEEKVERLLGRRVTSIDLETREVELDDGSRRAFGSLLIATGADPVKLPLPGATEGQVMFLRTFADSRAIVEKAKGAKRVVVVGASFIGLEVAASLRKRGLAVDVVARDSVPLERVMGKEVGAFVKALHEEQGVVFHLGCTADSMSGRTVTLSDGTTLDADFVVMGVGVRPALELAEKAGLKMDRGIAVSELLETSEPGIFAAGDVARWPDRYSGENIRVEHWVVAERQGQTAARNMLGRSEPFDAVPFFWSAHYDVTINYVGHAEQWDAATIDGDLAKRDATVTYSQGGRRLAVATIGRDRASLEAEHEMETER
jgi:NADPH-dependent 2,4-dienoyl-CoA reductase/sulfur reductase-like enzyme/nitrite reductase/ring-hydroxylating ferredoxin subunit